MSPPGELPNSAMRLTSGKLNTLLVEGRSVAGAYYKIYGTGAAKRGRIFIAVNQTASKEGRLDCAAAGRWRITLKNASQREVTAHLYIQRDATPFGYHRPGRQSYFDHADAYLRDETTGEYNGLDERKCPITRRETLSAIATSANAEVSRIVVVGAADGSEARLPAVYTSSGPVKLRRGPDCHGPDCSAITEEGDGHWGVLAAGTFGSSIVRLRAPASRPHSSCARSLTTSNGTGQLTSCPSTSKRKVSPPVPPENIKLRERLGAFVFRRPVGVPVYHGRYRGTEP